MATSIEPSSLRQAGPGDRALDLVAHSIGQGRQRNESSDEVELEPEAAPW